MAFYAVSASAQTPVHPHGQKHVGPVHAAPQVDVTARINLLDERIAMLTSDMKMFIGEMKVQAMADLIEALVERQTLRDAEMKRMHEHMGNRMHGHMKQPPPSLDPPIELEPDTLCSPSI
jgi:hypothetical protein